MKVWEMEANVKPGTRCECLWEEIPGHGHVRWPNAMAAVKTCRRPATEMVTVCDDQAIAGGGFPTVRNIPMCAPCAAYHEARQKAGA